MNRFYFVLTTILIGHFLNMIAVRYLTFFGAGPHFILLLVLALGFIRGPLMGQTTGFIWGLTSDAIGLHLFGLHSFLFALIGYFCGKLRKRIASEGMEAQMMIALVVTLLYGAGAGLMHTVFGETSREVLWIPLILNAILNALFAHLIFLSMRKWIHLWKLDQEPL